MAKETVFVGTSLGGYRFDAVIQSDHTSELALTEHPVQNGAAVTDHSYLKPKTLTLRVAVSDCATGGSYGGGGDRSVNAYQLLLRLQREAQPLTVTTRLYTYTNMMVKTVTTSEDYTTVHALDATVTLQEIVVAAVSTVKVSTRPQVTGSTNRGTPQAVEPDQSVLKQAWGMISGWVGGS